MRFRVISCVLVLVGCSEGDPPADYATLEAAVLRDVQGLYGGHHLFLRKDGTAVAVHVRPPRGAEKGMQERRVRITVSKEEFDALIRLLTEHEFLNIQITDRPGVPDEARPTISLQLPEGKGGAISKWANDAHTGFDAVYSWFLSRAGRSEQGEAFYEGPRDPEWKPGGF